MRKLADNLWLLSYPLKVLGADITRNISVIRLASGKLIIHSTAPFTSGDIDSIKREGEPAWLVEAMLDHDTFSNEGRDAFPEIPYFAPPGFEERVPLAVQSLTAPPAEWSEEIEVMAIEGNPSFNEYALFHRPSHTLIVADLIFNYRRAPSLWTKLLLYPAMGLHHAPGMSKRFRGSITDKAAFRRSLAQLLDWDFDRVIVGHGQVIESAGKSKSREMFEKLGFL
ncbi:hypothetical protein ACFQY0_07940 [Haloferula chungangensis]|uniref:DUF4336 domain-containing protein n=1 Tax=Haloferula chungangensis TaxID=1048331 RepID=A0ABW2L5U0_9BACT